MERKPPRPPPARHRPGEPTLAEVIRDAIAADRLELHTAMPGRVESYDKNKQTADVLPVVNGVIGSSSDELFLEDLPIIPNVPVGWIRGGGAYLQMKLAPGDHVYLVFSEAAFALWRTTGQIAEPGDLTRHDLSYAMALPVIAPDAAALAAIDDTESIVMDGPDFIRAGGPSADFLALAAKVEDELAKIEQAFTTFIPGSGGASFPDAYVAPSAGATATVKLKGE